MEPQNFESTSRGSHSSIPWYKSENGKWASPTFSSFHVLIYKQNQEGKNIIHVIMHRNHRRIRRMTLSESTASLFCVFHHFGFQITSHSISSLNKKNTKRRHHVAPLMISNYVQSSKLIVIVFSENDGPPCRNAWIHDKLRMQTHVPQSVSSHSVSATLSKQHTTQDRSRLRKALMPQHGQNQLPVVPRVSYAHK